MKNFEEKVLSFVGRFNSADLEGALSDFADDGQYMDEFGNAHQGKTEIRTALTPIFDGSYGTLAYTIEESIFEPEAEKALITWKLEISSADGSTNLMRGLDVLDFDGEKVKSKNCFIKAKEVLIEPTD